MLLKLEYIALITSTKLIVKLSKKLIIKKFRLIFFEIQTNGSFYQLGDTVKFKLCLIIGLHKKSLAES